MNWDVILELMDGRREEAGLDRPFQPAENEIRVRLARNGNVHTFHFSKVCCVMMKPKANLKMFPSHEQTLEEVITVTGSCYHVAVLRDQQFPNRFLWVVAGPDASLQTHLFHDPWCEDSPGRAPNRGDS